MAFNLGEVLVHSKGLLRSDSNGLPVTCDEHRRLASNRNDRGLGIDSFLTAEGVNAKVNGS